MYVTMHRKSKRHSWFKSYNILLNYIESSHFTWIKASSPPRPTDLLPPAHTPTSLARHPLTGLWPHWPSCHPVTRQSRSSHRISHGVRGRMSALAPTHSREPPVPSLSPQCGSSKESLQNSLVCWPHSHLDLVKRCEEREFVEIGRASCRERV